jgi:hypothetical protein
MAVRPTQGSKLFFLKGTPTNNGVPGGSVLDELAYPPASAVAAEAWSDEQAHAVGTIDTATAQYYKDLQVSSNDPYKDLHDHQSIIHDTED